MQDPRDLEALIAVADHGSISAAARALHTAQPALTRRLQRLERRASATLLERHRTGTRLTPAGRRLAARARPALHTLHGLDATPATGIALGVLPSTEAWLLDRLLPLLPDDLHPSIEADGLRAVADGRLDAALVSDWTDPPPGVTVLDLLREPYVVLCAPGHGLLAHHTLGVRALRAQHIVSAPHPDCGHRLAETGVSQRMAGSLAHAHALVRHHRGVALWPACTPLAPTAAARPLSDRSATRRLGLAIPANAPALKPLTAAVREAVRRRPGSRGQFLG
jgi:DNA-binding transcriptional LysR family regulator